MLLYYFLMKNRNGKTGKARIVARAKLPTRFGKFTILGVEGRGKNETAVVLEHGRVRGAKAPLVRIHSQCLTGDMLFRSAAIAGRSSNCRLKKIAKDPAGVLLYLPQEGRGIGLMNKLRAYELQDGGMDTVEANRKLGFADDSRDYSFSAEALKLLGVRSVRLLSNNPDKVEQLEGAGIRVVERIPCQPPAGNLSRAYLRTKKEKLGHLLGNL